MGFTYLQVVVTMWVYIPTLGRVRDGMQKFPQEVQICFLGKTKGFLGEQSRS
jgi:hypothetical protein